MQHPMRYLLILFTCLTLTAGTLAQDLTHPNRKDRSIVQIKKYYTGLGKIMDIKSHALFPSYAKTTAPLNDEEVLLAEKLMADKFASVTELDERMHSLVGKSYKEVYAGFYRQYVGLINNRSEKLVYLNLIRCCKQNIKKCFPEWQTDLPTPLHEDPCKATGPYVVNLTQKTISLY